MSERTVNCSVHGPDLPMGFVCRHVFHDEGPGWNESGSDELCPDAWCDACERRLDEAGGWSEQTMAAADIQLVCACCYHRLRGLRTPVLEFAGRSHEASLQHACATMNDRNARHHPKMSSGRYWYDLDAGYIEFRDADETPRWRSGIVDVGSYSETQGTWLSGWANRSLPGEARPLSAFVAGVAEARGWEMLAAPSVSCSLEDAWHRALFAAFVLGADGFYRAPHDGLHTFFALGELTPA